jgi:hypothetical protein
MIELSRLPHVTRVAAQTNLSCRLDWLEQADLDTLALWCTYHPDQVEFERFLGKHRGLVQRGVRHSVGIVGQPEHLDAARRLRAALDPATYLWVNAAEGRAYTDAEAARWTEIDELFPVSRLPHASLGRACRTGESVISVDGEGLVRRCHFVSRTDGPETRWATSTTARSARRCGPAPARCSNATAISVMCTCQSSNFIHVFRNGVLERVPAPDMIRVCRS